METTIFFKLMENQCSTILVIQQLRGQILTPNPPRVDKHGHYSVHTLLFVRVDKSWTKALPLNIFI